MKSATMASQSLEKAEEARRLSSLYLRPPVDRWNIVDFRTAKPLVNQGYRGTIKDIEAWWSRDKGTLLGKD